MPPCTMFHKTKLTLRFVVPTPKRYDTIPENQKSTEEID